MAEVIRMPKMSDTMEEGVIAQWLKKVGDKVKSGEVLAEIETDKATMEFESYWDGVLLHIGIKENESVPVDGIIAIIGKEGEKFDDLLKSEGQSASVVKEEEIIEKENIVKTEKIETSSIKATVITMPKMSDTMTEGTIASWLKKVGDEVKSGDVVAEIETDKATMEFESYWDGILLYVGPQEGESVKVNGILAVIGEKGADYKTLIKSHDSSTVSERPEAVVEANVIQEKISASSTIEKQTGSNGRVRISPLAKKIAREKGFDLSSIKGSGEGGRIVKRDVETHTKGATETIPAQKAKEQPVIPVPVVSGEEKFVDVPLSQMRKTIARRLSESKFSAPHFYLTMEINMDKAIEARKSMNEVAEVKISFNDLVLKAAAAALRKHPDVNVSWLGDKIRKNQHIHIGVAVAIPEGLIVPVVRFADTKNLSHISAEVKELARKAGNKELQPSDWEGSTFTVSNLGMFGIEEFTAIINPPDACIMAIGGIKQAPVVKEGQLVVGNLMKVTLSCDHRAVDGATGAAFLQTFKGFMEDPVRILI